MALRDLIRAGSSPRHHLDAAQFGGCGRNRRDSRSAQLRRTALRRPARGRAHSLIAEQLPQIAAAQRGWGFDAGQALARSKPQPKQGPQTCALRQPDLGAAAGGAWVLLRAAQRLLAGLTLDVPLPLAAPVHAGANAPHARMRPAPPSERRTLACWLSKWS